MEDDELHPPEIQFEDHVFDLAFHPSNNLIAAGLVDGRVEVYNYSDEETVRSAVFTHHKKSCRSLLFSQEGGVLFTASLDKSMQAVNLTTGSVFYRQIRAHDNPINVLHRFNAHMIGSGDDEGAVKLWDMRTRHCAKHFSENEDFVSDMLFLEDKHTLLVTSGDGSMTIYDIRKDEPLDRTDMLKDELLSLALMKEGKSVVCGSQSGVIFTYKYGDWFDAPQRFPGHPQSVDALVKITEDLMVTGSSDGLIRIVSVEPNDLVGIVGEHEDFPVERMRLSHDKKYLASSSHDNSIKFWNINYLYDDDNDGEEGGEEDGEAGDMAAEEEENGDHEGENGEDEEEGMEVDEHQSAKNKGKGRALDQDDDDEEDEEDGENSGPKKKKQKKRGKKGFYSDM